jgi:hypothetical protein
MYRYRGETWIHRPHTKRPCAGAFGSSHGFVLALFPLFCSPDERNTRQHHDISGHIRKTDSDQRERARPPDAWSHLVMALGSGRSSQSNERSKSSAPWSALPAKWSQRRACSVTPGRKGHQFIPRNPLDSNGVFDGVQELRRHLVIPETQCCQRPN